MTISISRVKMTPPPAARHNPWHESRKGFLLQMVPKSVRGGLDYPRIEKCAAIYPHLHAALPDGRKHLVPPECRHFSSGYEEKWPETFGGGVMIVPSRL